MVNFNLIFTALHTLSLALTHPLLSSGHAVNKLLIKIANNAPRIAY
jgi:hypothetical protein